MPVERILEAYGVHKAQLLPVRKGYRNESHAAVTPDGGVVNVIIYKRESDILNTLRRANLVGDYLADHGFPARHTRDTRIIRLRTSKFDRYAALYDYLPGETIPWEAYTMEHIKQLGGTMSIMHQRLQTAPFKLENNVADEYLKTLIRMQNYFNLKGVGQAVATKLGLRITVDKHHFDILLACKVIPNQQILHMDFVRGNILFGEQSTLVGVIDFEKTSWGHPLFDIARTLAFLLVDCKYKTGQQVRKYFLKSGYNKRGSGDFKISLKNESLLEQLVDLFLLYDLYKFLIHNPYESLEKNEHFIKTRDLLVVRKVIARV